MKMIRFKIPRVHPNVGGPELNSNMRALCSKLISEALLEWNQAYNNKYELCATEYAVYVKFEHEAALSMFLLTWTPTKHSTHWKRIRVVDAIDDGEDTGKDHITTDDDIKIRLELLEDRLTSK